MNPASRRRLVSMDRNRAGFPSGSLVSRICFFVGRRARVPPMGTLWDGIAPPRAGVVEAHHRSPHLQGHHGWRCEGPRTRRTAFVRAENIPRVPLRLFGDGMNRLFADSFTCRTDVGDEFENLHIPRTNAWRIFRLARTLRSLRHTVGMRAFQKSRRVDGAVASSSRARFPFSKRSGDRDLRESRCAEFRNSLTQHRHVMKHICGESGRSVHQRPMRNSLLPPSPDGNRGCRHGDPRSIRNTVRIRCACRKAVLGCGRVAMPAMTVSRSFLTICTKIPSGRAGRIRTESTPMARGRRNRCRSRRDECATPTSARSMSSMPRPVPR